MLSAPASPPPSSFSQPLAFSAEEQRLKATGLGTTMSAVLRQHGLTTLKDELSALEKSLNRRLSTLSARIDNLNTRSEAQDLKISQLAKTLAEFKEAVESLRNNQ